MVKVIAVALALVIAGAVGCQAPPPGCNPNLNISVDTSMLQLPDTCVSKGAAPAQQIITWRATDNSQLTIKIPDWSGTNPTTTVNPYPNPQCPAPGTSCTSGPFQGSSIPDNTPIQYSLTLKTATASKKILGHIIIKP